MHQIMVHVIAPEDEQRLGDQMLKTAVQRAFEWPC